MSLSVHEFQWVAPEVAAAVEGGFVQKVQPVDAASWVIRVRQPGQTTLVLASLEPELARVHLVESRPARRVERTSGLTMLMRKLVEGMVIRTVEVPPDDRVMIWRGDTADPDWTPPEPDDADADPDADAEVTARPPRVPVTLVFELTGRHTNLFVLGARDRILGQLRADALCDRARRPTEVWQAPPAPAKDATPTHATHTPHLDPDAPVQGRSAQLAARYEAQERQHRETSLRRDLASALKREHRRARRLVQRVEGDLARAEEAQLYKKYGELLQGAYGKPLARGATEARVPDYYAEGMPEITIPLDPTTDLQGNINSYFRQYRRMHDALERIESRLLDVMERVETIEAARAAVAEAPDLDTLEALHDDLLARHLLTPKQQPHDPQRATARPPYRTFRSLNDATILVGRGSRHNDALTTRVARGRDIWLHARDWSGAHVVLRMDRSATPNQADLHDAALLAAHFSTGKADTQVDVTYTLAKHVRKPRGAAPGMVHVGGGATLTVRPDSPRLQRLLEREV